MTKTFGPLNKGRGGGVALWIVLVVIVFVEI